ncbi:unnamed protein product [Cylicocyclus nassatus]|uniref:Ground-like domain-containing protein n=1 Tax=Cylicocyclus nassatus TaxID=53992 RepID=A0AA36H5N8_CYLNA|nr:unnamed protein product [Cylicocyclus nassatus]
MTAAGFFLIVVLTRPPSVLPFIFDLMNGLVPRSSPQCICAPPPCAASANAASVSQIALVGQSGAVTPIASEGPIGPPPVPKGYVGSPDPVGLYPPSYGGSRVPPYSAGISPYSEGGISPYGEGGPPYGGGTSPYGGGVSPYGAGRAFGRPNFAAAGFPHKKRRHRRRAPMMWAPQEEECTSKEVGSIIEQAMNPFSRAESCERIRETLMHHYDREVLVMCSPYRIDFRVTEAPEYCEKIRNGTHCYAFVF